MMDHGVGWHRSSDCPSSFPHRSCTTCPLFPLHSPLLRPSRPVPMRGHMGMAISIPQSGAQYTIPARLLLATFPKACAPGLMRSLASQIRVPASAPSCARNCMSSRRANSYIILSLLPLSLNRLLPKSLPLGHALRSDDVRPQVLCGHSCWCSLHRPVCLLRDPSEAFRRVL